jgi:hypothetical protein
VCQSFLSISPHLLGGTMAKSQTCCHLPGEMLNSAAECADRARIGIRFFICHPSTHFRKERKKLLPARVRLHVSDSWYKSPYDTVHDLHTMVLGFDYHLDTNYNCVSTSIRTNRLKLQTTSRKSSPN